PTFPHTGLGYIEAGEVCSGLGKEIFKVNSFREKPDLSTALEFLAKGNFFWNTGIYVWSVQAISAAFAKYSPEIYRLLEKIYNGIGSAQERDIVKQVYAEAENISVDIAVSEKADNLLLVPANFVWSDIGDWQGAYDLKKKDKEGNVVEIFGKNGWHLGVETKDCLLEIQDRLVATVGVSGLVIVETDDAVLVCAKERAQEVKKIVNLLKEKKETRYL
ncbi:MAG: sugar phosphate nucleotidyltransferase, partial [Microgenomates group bacterium]